MDIIILIYMLPKSLFENDYARIVIILFFFQVF